MVGRRSYSQVWFWSKNDKKHFTRYLEEKNERFVVIAPQEFRTRAIEDYDAIMKDEAKWHALESETIDKYFEDDINMFPYEGSEESKTRKQTEAEQAEGAAARPPKSLFERLFRIDVPFRFFQVQTDLIERRFPGGLNQTIGDADTRELVSCLRYVFARNFWHLVWVRRLWSVLFSLGTIATLWLACKALSATGAGVNLWFLGLKVHVSFVGMQFVAGMAAALIGAILVGIAIGYHWFRSWYEDAIEKSCSNLRAALNSRLQELVATIPLIFARIDSEKFELKSIDRLKQWPDQVKKWSKLAFWMSMRVEYLEFFIQVEMWRLRRIHAWARLVAVVSSWLIFFMFAFWAWSVVGNYWHAADGGVDWRVVDALIVAVGLLLIVNLMSYRLYLPRFDLIEKTLKTYNMKGSRDSKLHVEIEKFMFREKSAQLHEEEQRRGRGG